ncbi:MAG: hypothetical protein K1Y02_11280 [Candidatus Hydrogenedentes bacterium]|nr:hypothetical protein [Candidatus Hydrogenedentota bacterium]
MSREHFMPKAFGTFRNCPTLNNRLCRECNGNIGKAVDELVNASPVGLARYLTQSTGSIPEKPRIFYQSHHGTPPILIEAKMRSLLIGESEDLPIRCEWIPDCNAISPLSQVIIRRPDYSREVILLNETLSNDDGIQRIMRVLGIDKARALTAIVHDTDREIGTKLLRRIDKRYKRTKFRPTTLSGGLVPGHTHITFTSNAMRALAAIAFHYTLVTNEYIHGDEPEFASIRQFIMCGGNPDGILRHLDRPFLDALHKNRYPSRCTHVLLVDKRARTIKCNVALFIYPSRYVPDCSYEVIVGRNPFVIKMGPPIIAHAFTYTDEYKQEGFHGNMTSLHPFAIQQ